MDCVFCIDLSQCCFVLQFFYSNPILQSYLGNASSSPFVHFVSGGLAGITAASATYPLDLVRTRLAAQVWFWAVSVLSVRGLNGLLLFLSREIQCIIKVLGMLSVPYAEKKAFWVCIKDLVLLVGKLSFGLLCHMLSVLIVRLLTAWWYVFSLIQGVGTGGRARVYNTWLFRTFKHIKFQPSKVIYWDYFFKFF